MKAYSNIVDYILEYGELKANRTGVDALTVAGMMFQHNMADGFPLLTTKKMYHKGVRLELEFFIKGLTDKKWLQDRGCNIWNEWCSPLVVPYGNDKETKALMKAARELGPIYGWQWRHFGAEYNGYDYDYTGQGIDQLAILENKLKTNPSDRRMLVTAWNPTQTHIMALPACHYGFQVTVVDGYLNLLWNQRSVDVMVGLPFNIASYGLLLELLAAIYGFKPGRLIGFLADTHIYLPHVKAAKEQLKREPIALPTVQTKDGLESIFDWTAADTKIVGYDCHPAIKYEICV